jgi:uncharacterized protein YjbI with pentapeptide repeats
MATARSSHVLRAPVAPRFDAEPEEPALEALGDDLNLTEARLASADLSGRRLSGLRLADVVVERGNLANLVAHEPALNRVELTGVRLTGVQWMRGRISDTVFRDCRIDLATFAGTTFERVAFEDCRLAQTDFREALLRSVRFDGCDLTEADLTGLRVDRCELRGCMLAGAAGLDRLRGAAMPWADVVGNAGALAAGLGIRVLGEDER